MISFIQKKIQSDNKVNAVIKNNIIRLYSNCTKSQMNDPLIPIQETELSRLPFPNQSVIFDYRSALFNKVHALYRRQKPF